MATQVPRWLIKTTHGDPKRWANFRLPEIESLAEMAGIDPASVFDREAAVKQNSAFVHVNLPSLHQAKIMSDRAVLIQGVYECWAQAPTLDLLAEKLLAPDFPLAKLNPHLAEGTTYSVRVEGWGMKFSPAESQRYREHLKDFPFNGKVQLKRPDNKFIIFVDCGATPSEITERKIKQLFFVRETFTRTAWVHKYRLSDRKYIGPTSTKEELAFLMANQALVRRGNLVLDPFVGTGSLTLACAHFGAVCVGSDIDYRILHGLNKGKTTHMRDNFKQYNLPRPELLCADMSQPLFRRQGLGINAPVKQGSGSGDAEHKEDGAFEGMLHGTPFDAIICDPPYGVRAGARKVAKKEKRKTPIPKDRIATHIPYTSTYEVEDVMSDLLDLAVRVLRIGGRLVYLLPTTHDFTVDQLPAHPCLEVVACSEQVLRAGFSRWLITMRKHKGWDPALKAVRRDKTQDPSPEYSDVKDKLLKKKMSEKFRYAVKNKSGASALPDTDSTSEHAPAETSETPASKRQKSAGNATAR